MGFQNCPCTLETTADENIVQAEIGELGAISYYVELLPRAHGTRVPKFHQLDP